MKRNRLLLAMASAMLASSVMAGEAVFYVTEDGEAVQDLAVSVNGKKKLVGKSGFVSFDVPAGSHSVALSQYGEFLGEFDFATATADQNAEIQVEMIGGEALPEVNLYTPGQEQAAALGQISGYLESEDTGGAISGARISIAGTEQAVVTDEDGFFSFELARGEYDLVISDPNYGKRDVSGVRVMSNVNTGVNLNLSLEGEGVIEEVVAVGSYIPSTATAQERDSSAVLDAIGSEQMARFGDSSAASALKRVAGVSVVGGQFAVIRGLQGRYVSSTLNGSLMPSTDPLRRDVPLDLFPASVLGGIEIQKSYTADLPGDTTGGSIRMTTKGLPDGQVSKLKIGSGFNTRTTGSEVVSYRGGDRDFLGMDDGTREMPSTVDSITNGGEPEFNVCTGLSLCDASPEQAANAAKSFENNYNIREKTAGPDKEISYSFGDLFEMNNYDLGYYGALQYKDKWSARHDAQTDDLGVAESVYERSKRQRDLTGYFVVGIAGDGGDELTSKTVILRKTDDTVKQEEGTDGEGSSFENVTLEWVERQFLSQQFSGINYFGSEDEHEIKWRLGFAETNRYEPDRRTYTTQNGALLASTLERRFSELTETNNDIGVDYTFSTEIGDSVYLKAQAGVSTTSKERDVDLARFSVLDKSNGGAGSGTLEDILTPANFDAGLYQLNVTTSGTDAYKAEENIDAFYTAAEIDLNDEYVLYVGARSESSSQKLNYPQSNKTEESKLDSDEILPVMSLTWRIDEEWQLRAGISNTISRPGLTELSRSSQYDPETDERMNGNPDLEISKISNLDARIEYYFSDDESVSFALFNKEIDDPIEKTVPDGSGSAVSGYTFLNSDSATLSGFEFDFRKNVIDNDDLSGFVSGNLSYVDSEVSISGRQATLEGTSSRELQGQSKYLANFQFGFDHLATGQTLTILANYFDDRIDKVVRNADPVKEKGRMGLDLVYKWDYSESLIINAKAKNITDAAVEYAQGDQTIEKYYQGVSISFGAEMIF